MWKSLTEGHEPGKKTKGFGGMSRDGRYERGGRCYRASDCLWKVLLEAEAQDGEYVHTPQLD